MQIFRAYAGVAVCIQAALGAFEEKPKVERNGNTPPRGHARVMQGREVVEWNLVLAELLTCLASAPAAWQTELVRLHPPTYMMVLTSQGPVKSTLGHASPAGATCMLCTCVVRD